MSLTIRDMQEKDVEEKANVHWQTWQEAYTGLVDQGFLDAFSYEKCLDIARRFPTSGLVADLGGKIVGFALYGPCRDDDMINHGEVYALYILKEHYHQGIGYELMQACLKRLDKHTGAAVWALSGNSRAIHFYQRCGFTFDGAHRDITLGKPIEESRTILSLSMDS